MMHLLLMCMGVYVCIACACVYIRCVYICVYSLVHVCILQEHPLYSLLPFFGERFNLSVGPFESSNTRGHMLRLGAVDENGAACPPVDVSLLKKYLSASTALQT